MGSRPEAARCSALRRASAWRALHSPSLHQRLREEGRDPSLAHFPPSQIRTLPRSRSLTPSLSLALSRSHTRAHTPPRLPLSRPLSLRLLRAAAGLRTRPPAGAGSPALRSAPRRQDWGEPRAAPRGKNAGCRGRSSRIAAEGRLPSRREPPGPQERPGRRRGGRASGRKGSRGAGARPPRAPSSQPGGRGGSFPRPNFPRRGAQPPLGPQPAAPTSPPTPPAVRLGASGTPAGREVTARNSIGGQAHEQKGAGKGAHSFDTGTGTLAFPAPLTLCYWGLATGPLPEAGSGPGNTARRERVRAGVCVCERERSCSVRGHPEADSSSATRTAAATWVWGEEGSRPTRTPSAPLALPRCPRAVESAGGQAVARGRPALFLRTWVREHCSSTGGRGPTASRPKGAPLGTSPLGPGH